MYVGRRFAGRLSGPCDMAGHLAAISPIQLLNIPTTNTGRRRPKATDPLFPSIPLAFVHGITEDLALAPVEDVYPG